MLFTCLRMDCATVPEGLYISEVRHDDDQQGYPVQIANWIMVNRWGTLITNKPIRLEPSEQINNAYCDMDNGKMKSSAVNLMRVKNWRGKKVNNYER